MFKYILVGMVLLAAAAYATKAPFEPHHRDSKASKDPRTNLICYTSSAGSGGSNTEALTVTGLLSTDTVVAVSQKTPGASGGLLKGWTTVAADSLTGVWSGDPGAGAVLSVCVAR